VKSSLTSSSWYRVAAIRPRLRGHTQIHRRRFRGELWYILQDDLGGMYYRFSPAAYQLIGMMNGRYTVQELWDLAVDRYGREAPSQDELIQLLSQLHNAGALITDVQPDADEIFERKTRMEKAKKTARWRSPLFLKISLVDPDAFLTATSWICKHLFSKMGAVIWTLTVIAAIIAAGLHWGELTENPTDRILSAGNLFLIWLVYPFVKLLHELGHGYAVKRWGGEVHEMGVMLLVFMPIPYVEASASYAFTSKWHRAFVSSAGMLTEMFVAAVACLLWVSIEPGVLRSIIFNVMLIGSISTIVFNGNPLLRYDGYFIAADILDIPNLAQRGMNYLTFLVKKYAFGLGNMPEPLTGPGEKPWLIGYSICAFIYRIGVYLGIAFFIAGKFFFIGILLAIWASFTMFVMPIIKGLKFVLYSPLLRQERGRAITAVLVGIALLFTAFFTPIPFCTLSEGVTWIPEESFLRAGVDGFVSTQDVQHGSHVRKGQPLFRLANRALVSQKMMLEAQANEIRFRYYNALGGEPVLAEIVEEELLGIRAKIEHIDGELNRLIIRSPVTGTLFVTDFDDLPGRYLKKGQVVGYVVTEGLPLVRVVVDQQSVDLVRNRTRKVQIKFSDNIDISLPGSIKREVPQAVAKLPSPALTRIGGGRIAVDPRAGDSKVTGLEKMFQFDIEVLEPVDEFYFGNRVFVLFEHGYASIAVQLFRKIRLIFLKRFNV